EEVVTGIAAEPVVPGPTQERIRAIAAGQAVVPVAGRAMIAIEHVVPVAPVEEVVPGVPGQLVIPGPAQQAVGAIAAEDAIAPTPRSTVIAIEPVVTVAA